MPNDYCSFFFYFIFLSVCSCILSQWFEFGGGANSLSANHWVSFTINGMNYFMCVCTELAMFIWTLFVLNLVLIPNEWPLRIVICIKHAQTISLHIRAFLYNIYFTAANIWCSKDAILPDSMQIPKWSQVCHP